MENTIHRIVISAYCTLMLSSAFLTVGDGMLLASAAAQGSAKTSPVGIPELISNLRKTGMPTRFDLNLAHHLKIPLKPGEDGVPAKGRTSDDDEHTIAMPAESGPEYIVLTYDDEKRNESYYFLATPAGNLERAVISDSKGIRPVSGPVAEAKYMAEVAYWQQLYRDNPVAAPEPPER